MRPSEKLFENKIWIIPINMVSLGTETLLIRVGAEEKVEDTTETVGDEWNLLGIFIKINCKETSKEGKQLGSMGEKGIAVVEASRKEAHVVCKLRGNHITKLGLVVNCLNHLGGDAFEEAIVRCIAFVTWTVHMIGHDKSLNALLDNVQYIWILKDSRSNVTIVPKKQKPKKLENNFRM